MGTGGLIKETSAHRAPITDIFFTVDRMFLMTSSKDHSVKMWEMETYECVKTFQSDRPFNSACVSPLFNAKEGKRQHILAGGGQEAMDVTTTAGKDGKFEAVLFHLISEEDMGTVRGHFGPMNMVRF